MEQELGGERPIQLITEPRPRRHLKKKDLFIYFLERGEGTERGRETSMCGCLAHAPHPGPGPQPSPQRESNLRPFRSRAPAQPTEPGQRGGTVINPC